MRFGSWGHRDKAPAAPGGHRHWGWGGLELLGLVLGHPHRHRCGEKPELIYHDCPDWALADGVGGLQGVSPEPPELFRS